MAFLKENGLANASYTTATVVAEAMRRGIEISVRKNRRRRTAYLSYPGSRDFLWRGGTNNLNTTLAKRVTKYKQVASALLRAQGAPGIENTVFRKGQVARAWKWATMFEATVLKPTDATHGKGVFVDVRSKRDFRKAFAHITEVLNADVLVEEFCHGTEHRCVVVKNKLVAAVIRRPASVLGDGTSTIRELVERKNQDRGLIHKPLNLGQEELATLKEQKLSPDSVPPQGERVYLRKTSNIHTGGDAIDATDDLTAEEIRIIEHAAAAIPGAEIAGLDVLLPRASGDGPPRIIEINLSPMTSMHHFPWEGESRDVAAAVVDAMFPMTTKGDART